MKKQKKFKHKEIVSKKCKHHWCHVEGMMFYNDNKDCRVHWFVCSECGETKEVNEK